MHTDEQPWKQYAAVAAGGIVGAVLRELLEAWIPSVHGLPAATLLINWSGSFFLAWFYTVTIWRWKLPQWLRTGVGTGIVGAYTTFSTFAVESEGLFSHGRLLVGLIYIALSLLGGFALAVAGGWLGGEREEPAVDTDTEA
jgi:CrcB protein